jgi:hypothetical protein
VADTARTVERPEQAVAWQLCGHWITGKRVVLTLTERCMVRRLEGKVSYVAVTGAFAVIDGWHVPTQDVLGVATPHFSQGVSEAMVHQTKPAVSQIAAESAGSGRSSDHD